MDTRTIKTDTRQGYLEAVNAAAQVLEAGGIVGLPTETVYGLAASAEHPKAVERLKAVKKRPEDKKFTICLALKSDVKRFASSVPRVAQKLISRFWPGPLTLVLPGKGEGAVGVRMPGLAFTRDVLLKADTAVIIPSANPHGSEPARTSGEVRAYFDGQIELVVDGGPSPLGVASSVVEVAGDGAMRILRQGAISEEELRRTAARTILFVCTGNMCRSPMAEGIARRLLAEKLDVAQEHLGEAGFSVASAGTGAFGGTPPSREAIDVMREVDIDISGVLSQPLTFQLVREADDIFVMAPTHGESIKAIDPEAADRTRLVALDGRPIEDPIGQSVETYRRVRDSLMRAVSERIEGVLDENSGRK
ncbi:MAG: L-threonylcarbamoyladenylate synthase [Planctomycetota bacterium]|jgi:protein-tyrosine phosphatase